MSMLLPLLRTCRAGALFPALVLWLCSQGTGAAELAVIVEEAGRGPVADAVVFLVPANGKPAPAGPSTAVMDQRNLEFAPHVLAVRRNVAVSFPNSDNVRHHVYSFSPNGRFELRLYAGTPTAPVQFDQVGPVVLGCNIHDWMLGYIYVVDTPWFGQSGPDGTVRLQVPPGSYTLQAWHPRLADINAPRAQPLEITTASATQRIALPLRAATTRRRDSSTNSADRFGRFRNGAR